VVNALIFIPKPNLPRSWALAGQGSCIQPSPWHFRVSNSICECVYKVFLLFSKKRSVLLIPYLLLQENIANIESSISKAE